MTSRLATTIGRLALPNPMICGSGEPVMTEVGIRAALHAGAAGVIAKSVNERPEAARDAGTMAGIRAGGDTGVEPMVGGCAHPHPLPPSQGADVAQCMFVVC
ncbi:MAG TPA: hypothetical protein VMQ99_06755 [Acetobacteraceae bacterium]|jgi:hypothetical protein|nr:hypothetical protein [Acetobacteraceae bacterium]